MSKGRAVVSAPARVSVPSHVPLDAEAGLAPYVSQLALHWPAEAQNHSVRLLEGTLGFVDVSGFTRLTEILAGRGKAGAEELTGYLDTLFAELLAIAYAEGGELIKWGGDALLVWFAGEGHAERAVDSAWRMQRAIGRSGKLKTAAGAAILRMSVGVHSGEFHFFSVGARHRELVVTGGAASLTAQLEAVAEAGEILVSATTARLLDDGAVGAPKGEGFLVQRAPRLAHLPQVATGSTVVNGATPGGDRATAPSAYRPSLCVPAELRDHLLAAPVESEHRQVAIGFVEFGGVDERLARGEERAVAADLEALILTIQEACSRHGVTFVYTDIAKDGGKAMLVAGAPNAGGDHAGRMLVAVREILDAGGGLRLRAGVNHGRVFTGAFGPAYRRTYTAYGDAVNLAARLMARAAPGELIASEAILERSRVRMDAWELEPFLVKGKVHPVRARRVGAVRKQASTAAVDGRQAPPLVGREAELELLTRHLDAAFAGSGRSLELVGAPGMGKSRLVEELEALATGGRLLAVRCLEYQSVVPYAAMNVVVRQCLGLDPSAGPAATGVALAAVVRKVAPPLVPWLPLLASVVGADVEPTEEAGALDERFRRQRLEQAVVELLTAERRGPTLFVFENADLIDDASAALIRSLAAAVSTKPWLLLVARGPSGRGPVLDDSLDVERIEMQPLGPEAIARLVRHMTAAQPLSPHQRDALVERCAGNPLFLLELLGTGLRSGFATELPDSVEGVFAAQIDRLRPAERRLLRVASVLGVEVPAAVLEEMITDGEFDPAPLLGDFLTRDGADAFRFRHALLRDAAYEGLSYARRRELHARAAAVLERRAGPRPGDIAGLLAVHFGHAGNHRAAWHYARLAGERARAIHAPVEAATFFDQALHAGLAVQGIAPADLLAVAEALGDARSRLGQFADAELTYRRARRWATDPVDRARLDYKSALATDRAGSYLKTLRTLTRADHGLGNADSRPALRLRAEVRSQYGLVRHRQGRGHEAVRLLKQAVEIAEAARAPEVLATALLYLDIAEVTASAEGDGAHARRALGILWRLGDQPWLEARAFNQLGIRAYFAGRWSEAVGFYSDSRDACDRAGDRWTAAVESANIAEVLADQGHLSAAEPVLAEALDTYRAAGTRAFIADGTRLLGRLASRSGDAARGRQLLAAARDIYASDGESLQVLVTDAILAESLLRAGDFDDAMNLAERALARVAGLPGRHLVAPLALRVLGVTLSALRREPARAREALRESVELAREHDARYELALSEQALSDLYPGDVSDAELTERDLLFGELGVTEEARRVLPASLPEARV